MTITRPAAPRPDANRTARTAANRTARTVRDGLAWRALSVWLGSRLAVALLSIGGAWELAGRPAGQVEGFLSRWDHWDVGLFRKVAEFGYAGYPQDYPDRGIEAFFPGLPVVLRVVHVVLPDWTAAGLAVSLVAGCVAAPALARLADLDGVNGSRAVLYLVLSPYAVFLAAGYSESLFLACALPGWLAARRGHWRTAALLVAAAATVRVTGLFLACGLVVEYAVAHRGRPRPDAAWLAAPFVAVFAYVAYLHALTGDWLRWPHAQAAGWGRHLTAPLQALRTTYDAGNDPSQAAEYAWSWRAELLAVAVGLALTGLLLARRRWGEATYVGLSVLSLASSTYYLSVARASLLWFPLWILLAQQATRRAWVRTGYMAVAAPLMAVLTLTFTAGRWVG